MQMEACDDLIALEPRLRTTPKNHIDKPYRFHL